MYSLRLDKSHRVWLVFFEDEHRDNKNQQCWAQKHMDPSWPPKRNEFYNESQSKKRSNMESHLKANKNPQAKGCHHDETVPVVGRKTHWNGLAHNNPSTTRAIYLYKKEYHFIPENGTLVHPSKTATSRSNLFNDTSSWEMSTRLGTRRELWDQNLKLQENLVLLRPEVFRGSFSKPKGRTPTNHPSGSKET